MKEEEARTKWCPMVRVNSVENQTPHNRVALPDNTIRPAMTSLCIASECMLWRWKKEKYTPKGGDPLANDKWKPERNTDEGWCGLVKI